MEGLSRMHRFNLEIVLCQTQRLGSSRDILQTISMQIDRHYHRDLLHSVEFQTTTEDISLPIQE